MKILCIHPSDPTTNFLSYIHYNQKWTIVTNIDNGSLKPDSQLAKFDNLIKKEKSLYEKIEDHDKIIMMGHGTKDGLVSGTKVVINKAFVPLLKKKDLICIWCNADQFIKKNELKSELFTGMFISEYEEANMYNVITSPDEIMLSNLLFAKAVKENINSANKVIDIKKIYFAEEHNEVVNFNRNRLYSNT